VRHEIKVTYAINVGKGATAKSILGVILVEERLHVAVLVGLDLWPRERAALGLPLNSSVCLRFTTTTCLTAGLAASRFTICRPTFPVDPSTTAE
jgi:hypothetical protein